MAKTVADYKDAVERIYDKHVDKNDLSKADIMRAVKGANDNRIDNQTAKNIVDAIPTTENVAAALNQRGGIPNRSDIENTAGAIDQYDVSDDRVGNLVSQMESAIVTQSDVERLTGELQAEIDSGQVITDNNISRKVNDLTSDKSVLGANKGDVVNAVDGDLGINVPSQADIDNARKDIVEFDSGQSPRDVLGDEATELPNVGDATADQNFGAVRGDDGEIEAVVTPNESAGRAVSEELGAEYVTPDEVNSGFEIVQDRTGTRVIYNGETVREL